MELLRQLTEMAKLTKRDAGMGLTQYDNEDFILHGGFRSGNSKQGTTRLRFTIYDRKIFADTKDPDKAEIGFTELFVDDKSGEIVGLVNIEIKPKLRKSGYGKKIVRDIVDTTKSGLTVHDIQKKAKKFWDKMGVKYTTPKSGHIQKESQELQERLKNSGEEVTITMRVTGDSKERIAQLLHNISVVCSWGASRKWGIMDADGDEEKKMGVYFDGDGADHISDVKINGQPVKEFV